MKGIVVSVILGLTLWATRPVQAGWPPGENLLTPFQPSTEEWEVWQKEEEGLYSVLWQKKGAGLNDSYAVSVMNGYKKSLSKFRETQDEPGKEHCKAFESQIIEGSPTNGYSRLIWSTRCSGEDGFVAITLQVALQGHDSFYHVQKIWRSEVSEQEMGVWRERLSSVSVCDTRKPESPCPEGFDRVQ